MDKRQELLRQAITTIPNYPKPGVQFRDITSLLEQPEALAEAAAGLVEAFAGANVNKIVAIEARGFIFGSILAHQLGLGLVLARKPGKLPRATHSQAYCLEYGEDTLHIHSGALSCGDRVLLIDDLIATGGTAQAVVRLVKTMGAVVTHAGFVVALPELGGVEQLKQAGVKTVYLLEYKGL
ncbi:adenine phosphoribosyltransferase [Gilvimarinus agarilyticus]|uniref:adenine phosphoribosyltransferase n=1 Tax=Gilvimarinus sp. 2_MG-2023 TaxID=3062666 RepID=UPI001C0A1E20|nr:adenine phosphoribosyltransferase [Gilvimarinus sp. 2_MG-2023]MBU2887090.1 adenine phosphoribosyltransferase [Gilvimarinus agarilyticus]MDO6571749.1 adenine phosphoribosyltransferase [Gilvimarinus sp. 2_MG-2023]